jgi:tRNA A37 threonylcarbamoyltransferase TsaD
MKKMMVAMLLAIPLIASANYDANFTGTITQVLTYTHSDEILITVSGQPTSHPICTSFDHMAIDTAIPSERRQVVLSRILLAYASGTPVNIGYDSKDECIGSRVKIYRVG